MKRIIILMCFVCFFVKLNAQGFCLTPTRTNIENRNLLTTHVISHEMGHDLNLFHTHHGTFDTNGENGNDPYHCKELVNGSNSDTCGDYIEDTPADPNLSGKVNNYCMYTGTDTDALGQPYSL